MRLIMTRIESDDYTYSVTLTTPFEYESPEKFIIDFQEGIVEAVLRDLKFAKDTKRQRDLFYKKNPPPKLKEKWDETIHKCFPEPQSEIRFGTVKLASSFSFNYEAYTRFRNYDTGNSTPSRKDIIDSITFPEIMTLDEWFEKNKGEEI